MTLLEKLSNSINEIESDYLHQIEILENKLLIHEKFENWIKELIDNESLSEIDKVIIIENYFKPCSKS